MSAEPAEQRQGCAVVVAHPDDEILWLSSVLGSADRIVFCFGDPFEKPAKAAARRAAVAEYPLRGLADLAIPESGAGFLVDWRRPQRTASGIAISDPAAAARYEANHARLVTALRPLLSGLRAVHTHNPWGEYGHAEHIQVYRAVTELQAELGYTIWFSNYVAARSRPLAALVGLEPLWSQSREVPTDADLVRRLRRLYRQHRAWTWNASHRWPRTETLYAQPPIGDPAPRHRLGGQVLLDVAGLRQWPPPWRSAERRLE